MGLINDIKVLTGKKQVASPPTQTSVDEPVEQHTGKKILIVEDDQYLSDFYKELLEHEGFTVFTAENGKIGLEKAIAEKPNLMLLDLMMPVMDGKMLLNQLRQMPEFKTLPVIVLTNAGSVDNFRETKIYNDANDFLIKSNVSPEEIIEKIKRMT